MPPPKNAEKSQLKRGRDSKPENETEQKKPRRSQRKSQVNIESQLPSPITHHDIDSEKREGTLTPPKSRTTEMRTRTPVSSPPPLALSSPNVDSQTQTQTQIQSQFHPPSKALSYEVKDETAEGVWGYLLPVSHSFGDTLVLRRRSACPLPKGTMRSIDGHKKAQKDEYEEMEERYEKTKIDGVSSNGYLIGRHPECDRIIDAPTVSNRHCLIFSENKGGQQIAILEDLSGNGTFVNEAYVGRNKRRELRDGDEIAILDESRFVFRYPRSTAGHGFNQHFMVQDQLGRGHFATVYLAIERNSGIKYAVKKFEKRQGPGEKSRVEGLQQEIAVLMGVSHPNVLCLKDTFNESDGVYLVLELASEGELFNWIVMKGKLSESESRKVFIQLFQGLKYLHERGIVHRDIKPENILLIDKDLNVKLADFGLAKIIGEESFTTTLCGTPSYVAPEILENSSHRRYTKGVDIWSLGVVLYICLCGFPPFSDELYSKENPYNLSQQIKLGRFDYPSPYWDSVGDLALDLIDQMLTVDVKKRIDIDGCLEHAWTTQQQADPKDSIDGLTPAMGSLDFSKRKPKRDRTMLSSINDVKVSHIIPLSQDGPTLKVFDKNLTKKGQNKAEAKEAAKDIATAAGAQVPGPEAQQFAQYGVAKDEAIFGEDGGSRYDPKTAKGD